MRAVLVALAIVVVAGEARAEKVVRRRFDPEDLDLEERNVLHADMNFGVVRGELAGRYLMPDFDLDYGLAPNVEIGLDGAYAIEGTSDRPFSFDHKALDNLWISSKIGVFDVRDDAGAEGHVGRVGWAGGLQLGPRVALAPDTHGAGFQALALLGRVNGPLRVVMNAGGLVDPGDAPTRGRPTALLAGVDTSFDLDQESVFSIAADLSYVAFFGPDNNQLSTTAGLVWSILPWLDVSANGLLGLLSGGDHYGAYLGLSPKVRIF
jgi:hypothetical protein